MTNTTKMPWMKEDYTATKRAFKKKLGIFDKDVAIEEQEEQVRMEEESERMLIELDERHEKQLEEQWEDGYEEREMERRLENQEQRLLEEASENKNTMAWKDAIRIIQMLVFDHCNNAVGQSDDWAKSNEEIKQAWERILQG